MLALRSRAISARPCRAVPARARVSVVVRSTPTPDAVEKAIKEAEDACEGGSTGECAAAWDNVEEISAEISHKKATAKATGSDDPLEQFCQSEPDADECRVYED